MARAASAPKKEISMEEALWKSADKLRGSVEPAEYKHVVLSLFFLKFASDRLLKMQFIRLIFLLEKHLQEVSQNGLPVIKRIMFGFQ